MKTTVGLTLAACLLGGFAVPWIMTALFATIHSSSNDQQLDLFTPREYHVTYFLMGLFLACCALPCALGAIRRIKRRKRMRSPS